MNKIALLAFIGLFATILTAEGFQFNGNVTIDDPDGVLTFRHTKLKIQEQQKWASFRSVHIALENGEADVDTLAGVVSFRSIPWALMAYYDIDASWDGDSFELEASKNVMAKAFYQLSEINPAGEKVVIYGLGGGEGQSFDWTATAQTVGDLKYLHMETALFNNVSNDEFDVSLTFFISSVNGMIDLANTTINPRMLESVIRISNYTYADPANHLQLKIAVAHGNSSYSVEGRRVHTGNGLNSVYVKLAGECQVVSDRASLWGQVRSASVSPWFVDSSVRYLLDGSDASGFLRAKFGGSWTARVATIDFPANESNIIYDPTLGAGQNKAIDNSNASALIAPSFALILFALLSMIFL